LLDVLHDQAGIWTSPLRLHASDAEWLVPFTGATAAALNYDSDAQRQLGSNANRENISHNISWLGSPEAAIGEGIGIYALGTFSNNGHLAETGILATEAVIDASIVAQGFKFVANRARPTQGEQIGDFWPGGIKDYSVNRSFPSGHATASWAFARVIGEEYRSLFPRLLAYGFATTISVVRITGRDHFPSDVLVGGGIGFLTGGYVYRHHSSRAAENSLSFQPLIDVPTGTYGAQATVPLRMIPTAFRRKHASIEQFMEGPINPPN
jgi:membrane-associated phospholipid phosphatase